LASQDLPCLAYLLQRQILNQAGITYPRTPQCLTQKLAGWLLHSLIAADAVSGRIPAALKRLPQCFFEVVSLSHA
jgi:hypothetical protein